MYPPTQAQSALLAACALACALAGCGSDGDDPTPTLPPDTATPTPVPTPAQTGDDDAPPGDLSPEHTLLEAESGTWTLSGSGYSAMQGTLTVTETVDGGEDFSCEVDYFLTGSASADACPGCAYTYRILHTLVSGDPGACHQTDLPEDQEYRVLGYAPPGQDGGGFIYYDYNDTGEWLPWYEAELDSNVIDFSWSDTVGVVIE